MAGIAQLVRATVCGTVGRGFKTHYSPQELFKNSGFHGRYFCYDLTMLKPFKKLGDNWYEVLGTSLALILLLPVIGAALVVFLPLMASDALISWARKEPKPVIPDVFIDSTMSDTEIIKAYVAKAKELIPNLSIQVTNKNGSSILKTAALKERTVTFKLDEYNADIYIDDLNCYTWNTSETENLDLFFWVAVAALKNGVYESRTKFGRRMYWIKSDELSVWLKIRRDGSNNDGIYFYREPPIGIKPPSAY